MMSVDELKKCIKTTPFRPFTINIADGRRIPVLGRDFILIAPEQGRTVLVFQANDDLEILDTKLITGISYQSVPDGSASS